MIKKHVREGLFFSTLFLTLLHQTTSLHAMEERHSPLEQRGALKKIITIHSQKKRSPGLFYAEGKTQQR